MLTVGITQIVDVKADLGLIPEHRLRQARGADGKMWYETDFQIEITFFSAYSKYELIYGGINYGPVAAEYV